MTHAVGARTHDSVLIFNAAGEKEALSCMGNGVYVPTMDQRCPSRRTVELPSFLTTSRTSAAISKSAATYLIPARVAPTPTTD